MVIGYGWIWKVELYSPNNQSRSSCRAAKPCLAWWTCGVWFSFMKYHLCTAPGWFISHMSQRKVMGNIGASISLTVTLLIGIAGCLEWLSLIEYMEVWIRGMNWLVRGRQAAHTEQLISFVFLAPQVLADLAHWNIQYGIEFFFHDHNYIIMVKLWNFSGIFRGRLFSRCLCPLLW